MRLPFPERIPLPSAFAAATILIGLQQLQGTTMQFSFYTFLFIIISTITFNMAGGFTRPSGSYVFFYSVLGLIVGLVYKAYLGEPADSNLRSPIITMQVFCGGITGMAVAVFISRRLTRKRPLLGNLLKPKDMRNAAIGCFAFGLFLSLLNAVVPHKDATVLSAVMQLNRFLPMSVIISTLYAIHSSKGKSGFNALVYISIAASVAFGALSFSKEGLFTPALCWMVAACSMRLNVRPAKIAIGVAAFWLMSHYLVPYSQYGRDLVPEGATLVDRAELAVSLLGDLGNVREKYLDATGSVELSDDQLSLSYYNEPQGLVDRLSMIGPDDALINYTAQSGNYTGLYVIPGHFLNWIPHFLWPNKPPVVNGNAFAHKIGGILGEEDLSTGISFTPSGEAYQLAGWLGIFVVAPLIWIMVFVVFDSLCGDVRQSPWGLLVIAIFAHVAPEGMLSGAIYITWFGSIGIIFAALTAAYFMPILGTLLAGPESTGLVRLRRKVPAVVAKRPPLNRRPTTPPDATGQPV